jgi:hypothetical protein
MLLFVFLQVDWYKQVGPGSAGGGHQWGSAADANRIYVTNNNWAWDRIDLTNMNVS